jgi:hypothetical protein
VVAGTPQNAATAVVGGGHQRRLHVIFRAAIRGRRSALAAQPRRLGRVCQAVRHVVVRLSRRLRPAAVGAAVGSRPLHGRRRRRRPVQPAVHVPQPRRSARRRAARRDAHQPARRPPFCGAHLHARLGHAAPTVRGGVARLRAGQREPGGGHPVAACRIVGDGRGVPVAARRGAVASAAGRLRGGDGVHVGVLGRALRHRHPAGLGAGRDRDARGRPSGVVVVGTALSRR